MIYELLVSVPPHLAENEDLLIQKILHAPLILDNRFSPECENLLKRLLCRDPKARLGARFGFTELMNHPWFDGIDWGDVKR